MKCVVSNMVLPSLCLVSKSQVALLAYGSIPDVGSSSTTVLEPPIRAIPTLGSEMIINIDTFLPLTPPPRDHCMSDKQRQSMVLWV